MTFSSHGSARALRLRIRSEGAVTLTLRFLTCTSAEDLVDRPNVAEIKALNPTLFVDRLLIGIDHFDD